MFTDTDHGLLIQPNLSGAVPGLYGTHVHQNPDCGPAVVTGTMAAARAAAGIMILRTPAVPRGPGFCLIFAPFKDYDEP